MKIERIINTKLKLSFYCITDILGFEPLQILDPRELPSGPALGTGTIDERVILVQKDGGEKEVTLSVHESCMTFYRRINKCHMQWGMYFCRVTSYI